MFHITFALLFVVACAVLTLLAAAFVWTIITIQNKLQEFCCRQGWPETVPPLVMAVIVSFLIGLLVSFGVPR